MSLPNAFFAQPCFREASPDFEKLKAATKLSLKTSGIRLALAIDYYRVEAFLTKLTAISPVARPAMKTSGIFPLAGRN